MKRCGASVRWTWAFDAALEILPPRFLELARCDWFLGADPVSAGLEPEFEFDQGPAAADPRSVRTTGHVLYPSHVSRPAATRVPHMVLMEDLERQGRPWGRGWAAAWPVRVVVHELAHVVDLRLEFSHTAEAVDLYATMSRAEAFAEACAVRWIPEQGTHTRVLRDYAAADVATVDLLDRIEAGELPAYRRAA